MSQYGIWNGIEKRFVFGVCKETKSQAWREFCRIAPAASRCWRYAIKKIPEGWKNPPNFRKAWY